MKISLLPLAQLELDEAFAWYEKQVVGLGYEFLDEFDQTVRLIVSFPKMAEKIEVDARRRLLNRFPYGVIYGIDGNTVVVIAVAHLKRKPGYWMSRFLA